MNPLVSRARLFADDQRVQMPDAVRTLLEDMADAFLLQGSDAAPRHEREGQENGLWRVNANKTGIHVESSDNTHDVILRIDGDFGDRAVKHEYATGLARQLNVGLLHKGDLESANPIELVSFALGALRDSNDLEANALREKLNSTLSRDELATFTRHLLSQFAAALQQPAKS